MNLYRQLTLHFNDGSNISFDFPQQAHDEAARQLKIAEFLAAKNIVIEADGNILIFPVANIKYIALAGASIPAKGAAVPKGMIRGARVRA